MVILRQELYSTENLEKTPSFYHCPFTLLDLSCQRSVFTELKGSFF